MTDIKRPARHRRTWLVAVLFLSLFVTAAVAWPVRSTFAALLLLPHFFPGDTLRPLTLFTSPPTITTVEVVGTPGRMVADIYRPPGEGPFPAMILLLGVNPLPRDHDQVVTLAQGIARSGIATVVAESDWLLHGEIRVEEIDNLVALFELVATHAEIDPDRIGFSGFCVGAVLELIAAADPRIADRVSYVHGFSVYAQAEDVVRAMLSQSMPAEDGTAIPWVPNPLTRSTFIRHLISTLPLERDRALLGRELIELTPLTAPESDLLSNDALQLRSLLNASDDQVVAQQLATLPAPTRAALAQLSPALVLPSLSAHVLLMHDQADTYLPVSGARQLASAATFAPQPISYTEFRLFEHVVPSAESDPRHLVGETVKLIRHIAAVLEAAEKPRLHSPRPRKDAHN